MTDRELLQQALKELEYWNWHFNENEEPFPIINALRERLAQSRQWQGLTQEDMPDGDDPVYDDPHFIKGMAWADAVLMKKNGGGV